MGIFWAPAFKHLQSSGFGDWAWFHHMWEAGRVAILRWHEAPLWNPHHCGGASLWGNPQAQVFAPTYLVFALPFGTNVGHKLFVVQHAVCGWVGMYLLARRIVALSRGASLFAATVWCASGFFAWHGAGGHATFLSFYYGPLVLLAWRAAARDLRYAAAVAGLMVLILAEGGQYSFPFFALWLGLDLVVRVAADPRTWRRSVGAALVTLALTAALGAFRAIPVLRAVLAHPRPVVDTDSLTPREILFLLTQRSMPSWQLPGHQWVWPEYGAFVGWAVLALFAAGLMAVGLGLGASRGRVAPRPRAPRRELAWLVAGLALFFLLTEGRASPLHPWPLLQQLPIYKSIHLPSRWRVMLLLYLALVAGVGLDALVALAARFGRRVGPARLRAALTFGPPALLAAVAIADVYVVNLATVDRWIGAPVGGRQPEAHYYLVQGRNYLADFANYPSENVGTERCYDPVPWNVSPALRLGRVPQATVEAGSGTVVDWGRTSLTVWADVRLDRAALVTFNQNMAPGWVSDQGTVVDDRGLLALRTPGPFRGRLTVRFHPSDLPYSVGISLLGALACLLVARGARRAGPRS
jgi:hypothetical protein